MKGLLKKLTAAIVTTAVMFAGQAEARMIDGRYLPVLQYDLQQSGYKYHPEIYTEELMLTDGVEACNYMDEFGVEWHVRSDREAAESIMAHGYSKEEVEPISFYRDAVSWAASKYICPQHQQQVEKQLSGQGVEMYNIEIQQVGH